MQDLQETLHPDEVLTRRQEKHLGTSDMAHESLRHHPKYLSSELLEQLQNLNYFTSSNSNHHLLKEKRREGGEKGGEENEEKWGKMKKKKKKKRRALAVKLPTGFNGRRV